jgi:hypothetical protein
MKSLTAAILAVLLLIGSAAPALAVPGSACNQLFKAYVRASDAGSPGAAMILQTFNALDCPPP